MREINTPALQYVVLEWAGCHMMQMQIIGLLGIVMQILGLWLAKKYLLNRGWRMILLVTTMVAFLDAIPQFLTIFDVFRNQYFYLGEPIVVHIPKSAAALVNILLCNELADESNAALVLGLMGTIHQLSDPLGSVLSVQLFGLFKPDLSDIANFVKDTRDFRWVVAMSVLVSYGFSLMALVFLPLLPGNKADARTRKLEWSRRGCYAYITVTMLSLAFVYALLVDFISLNPELSCLQLVGGKGCK